MEKIIFYTIKRVQEYWHTLFCYLKAGCSSFLWTNAFSKKLFFYASLLLLGVGFTPNSYGQLVGEGGVKANFGVDGDAYANFIGFSIADPFVNVPPPPSPGANFMNTDDWFQRLTGDDPISWPGSGRGVIDQTNLGILPTDPEGTLPHDLGDIRQHILDNSNYAFEKRQAVPPLTVVNTNSIDYLWIDAVYGRDYNVVGIKGDAVDKSWFTSGADKNADNPSGWTLGDGSGGPQKDDIIDAMAHLRGIGPKLPTEIDPRPFTTLWAFGAATLRSTSGDKHIDFEFFRTLAKFDAATNKIVNTGVDGGRTAFTFRTTVGPAPGFEPVGSVDKPGTILVSIDYSGGGRVPGVEIRVWMEESVFNNFDNSDITNPGRPFNVVPGTFVKGTDSGNFGYGQIIEKDAGSTPDIFGRVNVEGSTPASPWGTLEGEGADFSDEYLTLQHVEIGINLTAFGLDKKGDEGPCADILGSLLVKTRSSGGSLTSELKDFVGPFPFGNTVDPPVITPTDLAVCANVADDQTFNLNDRITVEGTGTITFHTTEADRDAGTNAISAEDALAYPVPIADSPKTIWVRGSTTAPGCFGEAQFTITVNTNPEVDNATATFCDEDQSDTTLSDYDDNVGPGAGYTVAWFSDAARTIPVTTTGNLAVGSHTFYATVTNDTTDCYANAELVITINATPEVDNATATFCDEDQSDTTLSDYDDNVGPGAGYTVAWFSDAARTIPVTVTGNLAVGSHTFYATVTNDDTDCDANAELVITINATPEVDNATATFCDEDQSDTTLSDYDDNVGPGAGYTVAWFSDAARTIPVTTTGNLAVGSHTFYATVTNNTTSCDANAELVITINATPTCEITGEQTICSDSTSTFTATAGMASYSWTGPVGFTPATTQSITVSIAGIYEVTITDANGCSSKCTRELIVENCGYGCTPGFWQGGKGKQLWDGVGKDPVGDVVGFTTNTSFYDVFTGVTPGSCDIPSSLTMIEAITLGGGNCRKLVRHGVAGVLNAATLEGYPLPTGITTIQGLIDAIEDAINNSCGCEPLASQIAANNELNHDLCGTVSEDALDLLISNALISAPIDGNSSSTAFDAYPVPFKDQLTIKYKFDYTSDVKIEVFNLQGILVFSTTDNSSYMNKEVVLNLSIPREQEQLYVVKLTTDRGSSIKKVLSSVKN